MKTALAFCAVLTGACAIDDDLVDESKTEQSLLGFSNAVMSMRPVGYWRLGDRDTTSMWDTALGAVNGQYQSGPGLGWAGGIAGDPDTSVYFPGQGQQGVVNARRAYSLTQAWDLFARPATGLASSWGTSDAGDSWEGEVTTSTRYRVAGGYAQIDPGGSSGTFQQGIVGLSMLSGDAQVAARWYTHPTQGVLQPVAIVAQRINNHNFVRAELRENPDRTLDLLLTQTVSGVDTYLATYRLVQQYEDGLWFYVRFQFDGINLRARAWNAKNLQPKAWQVTATASTARPGNVAIRYANSVSGVRPVIDYKEFRVQTLGLSVHAMIKLRVPNPLPQTRYVGAFGKGIRGTWDTADANEYELRVMTDPAQEIKWYVFNPNGGYGAGVDLPKTTPGVWYDMVMTLDPGDYLDLDAGIHVWVDGAELPRSSGASYQSGPCLVKGDICWQIWPRSTNAPVRFGTFQNTTFFDGNLDEVAIFPRTLTPSEIQTLYAATR